MKAICWHGKGDVRFEEVDDPRIEEPGDVLGHEFMGEVVETGAGVERLAKGDRVVVPFNISCGHCWFCER